MNETTLPSRHRIRISGPGGLRSSTLPLSVTEAPHNIETLRASGEETFISLRLEGQSGVRIRVPRFCKQAGLSTAPGHRP